MHPYNSQQAAISNLLPPLDTLVFARRCYINSFTAQSYARFGIVCPIYTMEFVKQRQVLPRVFLPHFKFDGNSRSFSYKYLQNCGYEIFDVTWENICCHWWARSDLKHNQTGNKFKMLVQIIAIDLLPDTKHCGLRMHRECRDHFPRHHG